ncbi:RluA family pseudouridine synthase [Paraglaciecola hydrolytica]|uniref:RluA family pseudouridine synthase n=1 Tax=Paraglaciecola hydrolytica TaxID=1799789 RepID=UPI00083975B2|nr:RluA family pseudouridine synthase [Paraglaciecola hydrolytica]
MSVIDNFVAPPCHEHIKILWQDEHILLINKPSGLLSLSGKNPLNKDSVHHRLVEQFPTVTLAHRLDFGTSGIMLLAKSKEVNAQLTKQFQQRTVIKRYEAILAGHVLEDSACIELSIAKDPSNFPRLKVCELTGKPASSHYRVVERLQNPESTRVLFTPLTGRTHQLRIHSQAIQHPILGCDLYGTTETQAMSPRLLLHAVELEFLHPQTNEAMKITCPSPFDALYKQTKFQTANHTASVFCNVSGGIRSCHQ